MTVPPVGMDTPTWHQLPLAERMMARMHAANVVLDGTEFSYDVGGAVIRGVIAGEGEPLLLLHGFPQTRFEWRKVWGRLTARFTVVATDLRGYGESEALEADFTFRAMARDQVDVMRELGFDRFHVVGHDRGARVVHRMALDSADALVSATLIDIHPTTVVWERMDAEIASAYWHWPFLSQANGNIAEIISSAPESLVWACLGSAVQSGAIEPEAVDHYEAAAARPSVQRAFMGDYRAAATRDPVIDAEEPSSTEVPALIVWGTSSVVPRIGDPRESWAGIFANAGYRPVDSGHFIPEEQPDDFLALLLPFLAQNSEPRAGR